MPLCVNAVSPSINLDDEAAAADLFGPDEWGDGDGNEPAVASRDASDGGEVRLDSAADEGIEESIAQTPVGLPSPSKPTAIEVALHWLTHLPYRSWCRWCVSAKRRNAPHHSLPTHSREIPLLVADYCFLRDHRDEDLLTCFVGRLYPSRALISIPCDSKGVDDYAVGRLSSFLKDCGINRLVHMCDQERPLGAMIDASLARLSGTATWVGGVRERSAVGESQSNGKAEAAVQAVEDQIRVMKAALESRIGARIPSQHPVMKWLVEYASVVLNKYAIQPSGHSAYHDLHGKKVSERLVEFGEVVLHYVPKKRRHKLDCRWALGIFLGTTMASNECYIGLSNGTVVRGRAINRVRPDKRWSTDLVQSVLGTPANPMSSDDSVVESFSNPHANAGDAERDALDGEVAIDDRLSAHRRTKITKTDIARHGPSDNCPKCRAYKRNNWKLYATNGHSEACRLRLYRAMEEHLNNPLVDDRPNPEPEVEAAADFNHELAEFLDADLAGDAPEEMDDPPFDSVDDSALDDAMTEDDVANHPDAVQFGMDIDALLALGVEPVDATRFVRKCMLHSAAVTFHEAYGRGGLSEEARKSTLDIKGLRTLDFACTREDGSHWDFSRASDRKEALELLERDDPDWVVGSPPRTAFSMLNVGLNYPKMDKEEVRRRLKEGLVHLKFVCQMYRRQMRCGKLFLHEHPVGALSWKTKPILKLLKSAGVYSVVNDQCMFGLTVRGPNGGEPMLAKKPTRWMTNSIFMSDSLNVRCDGSHSHQHLVGGRAAGAAFYPPKLLRAILRGMAMTRDATDGVRMLCDNEQHLIDTLNNFVSAVRPEPDRSNTTAPCNSQESVATSDGNLEIPNRMSSIPLVGGGALPIEYSADNFKKIYRDEYTGEELPLHLVRAAMEEELEYFNAHVWDAVDRKLAYKTDDFKLVRMRWVICNKGDDVEYDVRARLVACEVNTFKTDEYFASTPPLEAKKLLFSEYATIARQPSHASDEIVLSFVDIKKAYFNGVPRRNVHLAFPKELAIPEHLVAHLKRCVYGTRDAGAIWEDCYADALVDMGFERGTASPCCFHHPTLRLRVVVHGDDFTCLGPKSAVVDYEDQLASRFEIKRRGHIGESEGCIQEIRILNRILRLTESGLRYEADPRHAEMLVKALGLTDASSVLTPGIKESSDTTDYDALRTDEHEALEQWASTPIDEPVAVAAISVSKPDPRTVKFDILNIEIRSVVPYSEIYGLHPRSIVATRDGWRRVPINADPFTGRADHVGVRRLASLLNPAKRAVIDSERRMAVNSIHWYGAAWEDSQTLDDFVVGAVRTASAKTKNSGRKGAKAVKRIEMEGNATDLLSPEQATTFRALAARGNFLSQDRVDVSFATKELCREFAAPANSSNLRLKRLARFLIDARRLVYRYDWSTEDIGSELTVFVDTDFAGCRVTRRSTNGGVMMRGSHCIKHWSTTQPTIALSSGEAELGGLCKGAANAIGLRSVARDLGICLTLRIRSDATAALGIARRLGIGKIRHLDTSLLWIQQKIKHKSPSVDKVLGADNPADCLTKYVDRGTMLKHLATMGLEYESGRADSAPQLAPDRPPSQP